MRPHVILRAAAIAVCTLTIPVAQADAAVLEKRLHVRVGDRATVIGSARPGVATLEIRRRGRWRTVARDRVMASGRYILRDRVRRPMSVLVRARVNGVTRPLGRLNGYRRAYASWYGPGLYGNHLGCGGRLTTGTLGVAHKTLPCGTKVTIKRGDRTVRVPVVDRGPFVGGREYDLTSATAAKLGFPGLGTIQTTR